MSEDHGYRVLLMDLDGTVVDYARTEAAALVATHRAFFRDRADYPSFAEAFHAANDELWASYRRGEIGLDVLRTQRFARVRERLVLPPHAAELSAVVARFEDELARGVRLFADSPAALRALRVTSSLVLVTDGIAAVQHAKLSRARLRTFFEHVVISSEVGYRKPDPALLRHALGRVGADPAGALVVGDSLDSDGAGARAAGIDFCWVNRGGGACDGRGKDGRDGEGGEGGCGKGGKDGEGGCGEGAGGGPGGPRVGVRARFQVPDLAALVTRLAGGHRRARRPPARI